MINKMPIVLWRGCCADLSFIDWFLSSHGITEYATDMRRAREALEDEENPATAGVLLLELLDRLDKDVTVDCRMPSAASRPGDREALACRITSLAKTLVEYPVVYHPSMGQPLLAPYARKSLTGSALDGLRPSPH